MRNSFLSHGHHSASIILIQPYSNSLNLPPRNATVGFSGLPKSASLGYASILRFKPVSKPFRFNSTASRGYPENDFPHERMPVTSWPVLIFFWRIAFRDHRYDLASRKRDNRPELGYPGVECLSQLAQFRVVSSRSFHRRAWVSASEPNQGRADGFRPIFEAVEGWKLTQSRVPSVSVGQDDC